MNKSASLMKTLSYFKELLDFRLFKKKHGWFIVTLLANFMVLRGLLTLKTYLMKKRKGL